MNFSDYFLKGLEGTLRFANGKNLSYKGPWVSVFADTEIDSFYVGSFMAAEYTIAVDSGNTDKEIIKCLVVAGPETANLSIYGRTSLDGDLITLTASVNTSKVSVIANPVKVETPKLIYSVNYYYTINELTST